MIQENNLDVFLSHLEFQQTFEQETHNWQVIGGNSISSLGPDSRYLDQAALEQRAFDIREKLKHAAATHNFLHSERVVASCRADYGKQYCGICPVIFQALAQARTHGSASHL
jgi:hypothetical protein